MRFSFIGPFWNRGASKAAKNWNYSRVLITGIYPDLPFSIKPIIELPILVEQGLFGVSLLKHTRLLEFDFWILLLTHSFGVCL